MLPEKIDRNDEDAVHQASAGYRARPWPPHLRQHMLQSVPYFIKVELTLSVCAIAFERGVEICAR